MTTIFMGDSSLSAGASDAIRSPAKTGQDREL
jgi:hypothetical protein